MRPHAGRTQSFRGLDRAGREAPALARRMQAPGPMLSRFIPEPRLVQVDHVDVVGPPSRVFEVVRHFDLGSSPLIRGLFALRTLPGRLRGEPNEPVRLGLDEIGRGGSGFRVLEEEPGKSFTVGAVGQFWRAEIPFRELEPGAFAEFREPGFGKVAWELRVEPLGDADSRVVLEIYVSATDDEAWAHLRRYFRVIGPVSHFIRRHALTLIARELGTPAEAETTRLLAGDELLSDAKAQMTHGVTIDAPAADVWPWLLQMGCRRGGWYSHDLFDNGGTESAWELHPELAELKVGDLLPTTPEDPGGFEVLRVEAPHTLVLGGLYDLESGGQLAFDGPRPTRYWQVTWAFVLEALSPTQTRLHVRARATFAPALVRLRALAMAPVHHFMQVEQLRNLKHRAEGRPHDSLADIGSGAVGAVGVLLNLATPFLFGARCHWGVDSATAERSYPGDERVPAPTWSWTHGVEIEAPADAVWPWLAQLGQDKAGFYSYQALENLAGCQIRNARRIHPEWTRIAVGDPLRLHPRASLTLVGIEPNRWMLAEKSGVVEDAEQFSMTWLFHLEPLGARRCRLLSRMRASYPASWRSRLAFGPYLTESVGFVMDRKMLLGIKQRVERAALAPPQVTAAPR